MAHCLAVQGEIKETSPQVEPAAAACRFVGLSVALAEIVFAALAEIVVVALVEAVVVFAGVAGALVEIAVVAGFAVAPVEIAVAAGFDVAPVETAVVTSV